MKKEIQKLFDDIDIFAHLIDRAIIRNLSFDVYNFSEHAMMVDLIFSPKNQFSNHQEAFSALFKKELFEGEEWDINDEPSFLDEEWIRALKNYWIKNYFPEFDKTSVELINPDIFIERFQSDLCAVNVPERTISKFLANLSNVEVVQVHKGYLDIKIFGQSDSHYFIFEYGIYD